MTGDRCPAEQITEAIMTTRLKPISAATIAATLVVTLLATDGAYAGGRGGGGAGSGGQGYSPIYNQNPIANTIHPIIYHPVHGPGSSHDPIVRDPVHGPGSSHDPIVWRPVHGPGSSHDPIVTFEPYCCDPAQPCPLPYYP
jgi:hypothetical protein